MFLRLLCIGDGNEMGDVNETENESLNTRVLSIAQDIAYPASGERKPTPKHIGIGVRIHQATRSKELVQLLHAAGHSVGYESVLRADSTIANEAVKQYQANGEVFMPMNFMDAKLPGYVTYANDNIDINEETLDGKGTFHASQTAAFRRQESGEEMPKFKRKPSVKPGSIPSGIFALSDSNMLDVKKPSPEFYGPVTVDAF